VAVVARPPTALRLVAAGVAFLALLGVALVLLVATLMGGLAPKSCGAPTSTHAPSAVALADIRGNYLDRRVETPEVALDRVDPGDDAPVEAVARRSVADPVVRSGENFAGAGGPGQFLARTWERYGVDGDGDGLKSRYNPVDAIPATANLLRQSGAPADYRRAIFAYNHASWYVDEVLTRAARYRGATGADPNAAQLVAVADVAPAPACASAASGPADLGTAIRLTSPAAYRALPSWAMAGGRPSEPVDARIYDDVLWVLRRYGVRVSAAREAGHHTHGDGTAVDLVPAVGATQVDWDATAGRLANDLGWTTTCGASGARPACPLKPAIQWIGYDGYPGHGSPRTCSGGCPAHIHVSWVSGCYGSSALVEPCAWVIAFPVPGDTGTSSGAPE
jgi:hypothetical protein